MKTHEVIYSLDTLSSVADDLSELCSMVSVFAFSGPLGVGKTTLIAAIFKQCGVQDETIQSPTFTYLNTYASTEGHVFYHFDLYRIKSLHDFCLAHFDEYLYEPNSWAFIEWPEVIMPLLTKRVCHLKLDYCSDNRRRIVYHIDSL